MKITHLFLRQCAAGVSSHGHRFTAAQLELLGLTYPPTKGWMAELEGREITDELGQAFYDARLITRTKNVGAYGRHTASPVQGQQTFKLE